MVPVGYMPASLAEQGSPIQYCPQGVSPQMMAILHAHHQPSQTNNPIDPAAQRDQTDHGHHGHHGHHGNHGNHGNHGHHGHHGHHGESPVLADAGPHPSSSAHHGHANAGISSAVHGVSHSGQGHGGEGHESLWQSNCDFGAGATAESIAANTFQESFEHNFSSLTAPLAVTRSLQSLHWHAQAQRAPPQALI